MIYERDPSMVFRKIGDETFLVPVRNNVGELDNIYILNEMGAQIWELLNGRNDVEQIRTVICDEYDIAAEEAEKDVRQFLESLESVGAIKEKCQ